MDGHASEEKKSRCILITGASSGIGYQAALNIINAGHRLILPCRNEITANKLSHSLKRQAMNKINFSEKLDTPVIDLSDLNSIERCVSGLRSKGDAIDTLVLNAGLQYTGAEKPRWSSQGFELTFAVNHLGHQFLTQQITPLLNKSANPRVVITASEVHNPKSPGGRIGQPACVGKIDGLIVGKNNSMIDGALTFNADKAYKDSKLCNLLFARELDRRLKLRGNSMPVITWAPGLVIPRSNDSFFRYSRTYNEFGQYLFSFIARDLLRITESPEKAGELLMLLATDPKYSNIGFTFFSNKVIRPGKMLFEKSTISDEAHDNQLAQSLWNRSADLCNISRELNVY